MPDWSPIGAERFLQLVDDGFYSNLPLFRCIENFVCQFGSVFPRPNSKDYSPIQDDPPKAELRHFKAGYLSFAGYAAHSRSTHVFIALEAVTSLGTEPFETPFGYVSGEAMATVRRFNTSYGENAPDGKGPDSNKIEANGGEAYLKKHFPLLDYFVSCSRK